MESVLHVAMVPGQYLRLLTSLGNFERAVRDYRALHAKWPEAEETKQLRLLRAGELFVGMGDLSRGQNAFVVCWQLYPSSSRALAGIADVFARSEQRDAAINFYRSAMEKLPDDNSLEAAVRAERSADWAERLKGLMETVPAPLPPE